MSVFFHDPESQLQRAVMPPEDMEKEGINKMEMQS